MKGPMNQLHDLKSHFIVLGIALLSASEALGDFNPVALTTASFNRDVVVERTSPGPIGRATTATMDAGTNNTGDTWYEVGFNTASPTTGVPAAGLTFTSAAAANHQF